MLALVHAISRLHVQHQGQLGIRLLVLVYVIILINYVLDQLQPGTKIPAHAYAKSQNHVIQPDQPGTIKLVHVNVLDRQSHVQLQHQNGILKPVLAFVISQANAVLSTLSGMKILVPVYANKKRLAQFQDQLGTQSCVNVDV